MRMQQQNNNNNNKNGRVENRMRDIAKKKYRTYTTTYIHTTIH